MTGRKPARDKARGGADSFAPFAQTSAAGVSKMSESAPKRITFADISEISFDETQPPASFSLTGG